MSEITKITCNNTSTKELKRKKCGGRVKMTHEQYKEKVKIKNPTIIPLEEYISIDTKINHKCLQHDIIWSTTPKNILDGKGCPKCKIEKFIKSKTKKSEQYIEELKMINPYITIVEDYITAKKPILHRCELHGIEWKTTPNSMLSGCGCKLCRIEKIKLGETLSNEEYLKRLKIKNPDLEPLEDYINMKTPIMHYHKSCGHTTKMLPTNALAGNGCNICVGKKIGLSIMNTHEEIVSRLLIVNPNVELLEKYSGANNKIKCKCKKCGHIWSPIAASLLNGFGCPKCRKSKGEERVETFLNSKMIKYEYQYKYDGLLGLGGNQLSYDFYLPKYNILIEFQGIQHKKPICFGGISEEIALSNFSIQQEHDRRKREYAKEHNINLLEIWYYEINKTEQIIEQYLSNLKLESVETTGVA